MKIRTFELCAGYDSQLMALERLKKKYSDFDYECIGWSEIEPNAIALHNACFPSLSGKNFGDMTKIDWSKVADFDLLTYSTPCQSVSQAGKQKGFDFESFWLKTVSRGVAGHACPNFGAGFSACRA